MPWLPKNKVVVPVDFSPPSLAAVETALSFVADASHLHVIHVLPMIIDYESGMAWATGTDEARQVHARAALEQHLEGAKFKGIHLDVSVGDPGHAITDFAESIGADLIVLPSHGRTGISRLLIGSVAERVVRLAPCAVVVLKIPHEAKS